MELISLGLFFMMVMGCMIYAAREDYLNLNKKKRIGWKEIKNGREN